MNPIQYKISSDFTPKNLSMNFRFENIHVMTLNKMLIISIDLDSYELQTKGEIDNKCRCLKLIIIDMISFVTESPLTLLNSKCEVVKEPIVIKENDNFLKLGNKDYSGHLKSLIEQMQMCSVKEKKRFQVKLRSHRYRLLEINKMA